MQTAGLLDRGMRHPVERAFTEDGKHWQSPSANAGPGPLNRFSWIRPSAGFRRTSRHRLSYASLTRRGETFYIREQMGLSCVSFLIKLGSC